MLLPLWYEISLHNYAQETRSLCAFMGVWVYVTRACVIISK